MARTRINCPNCRQPIVADVQQIFDVGEDPSSKNRLLSGMFNVIQCPVCGYQGGLATPLIYHDPAKELLLTYVPPELGIPRNEQERLLGSLINQVVNKLKPEQRKAYILQPQAHLTLQSLIERVLEADGITREMIQAQQARLNLLQRLATASDPEVRMEILRQEEALVDADLFAILSRLLETAAVTGDERSAKNLEGLQNFLLENTKFGQEIRQQTEEIQEAIRSLQEAGRGLTREKLLDLVIQAPNETRLSALVSLARQGMDYQFFQMLSERIEKASGEEKERLVALRTKLLDLTSQIDAQLSARLERARKILNQLLAAEDVRRATQENLEAIDDFFLQVHSEALQASRNSGDLEKISKLQQIAEVIKQASAPPPEIELIEDLLEAPTERERQRLLEENKEKITPDFLQMLSGLLAQVLESNQDGDLVEKFKAVNRHVLRFSMQSNLKDG